MDPVRCIARIASKVGLQVCIKRKAIDILRCAEETRKSAGKDPMGVCCSSSLRGQRDGE